MENLIFPLYPPLYFHFTSGFWVIPKARSKIKIIYGLSIAEVLWLWKTRKLFLAQRNCFQLFSELFLIVQKTIGKQFFNTSFELTSIHFFHFQQNYGKPYFSVPSPALFSAERELYNSNAWGSPINPPYTLPNIFFIFSKA